MLGQTSLFKSGVKIYIICCGCAQSEQYRNGESSRDHICHKHHKQRLCKIIITRVKVHFVNVFLDQLKKYDSVFGKINPCFSGHIHMKIRI